jgi:hypothetical protein
VSIPQDSPDWLDSPAVGPNLLIADFGIAIPSSNYYQSAVVPCAGASSILFSAIFVIPCSGGIEIQFFQDAAGTIPTGVVFLANIDSGSRLLMTTAVGGSYVQMTMAVNDGTPDVVIDMLATAITSAAGVTPLPSTDVMQWDEPVVTNTDQNVNAVDHIVGDASLVARIDTAGAAIWLQEFDGTNWNNIGEWWASMDNDSVFATVAIPVNDVRIILHNPTVSTVQFTGSIISNS